MKACSTQSRSLMINLFVRKRILLALKIACHVPAILPKKKAEYEYNIFFQKSRQEISICDREIVEKFADFVIRCLHNSNCPNWDRVFFILTAQPTEYNLKDVKVYLFYLLLSCFYPHFVISSSHNEAIWIFAQQTSS